MEYSWQGIAGGSRGKVCSVKNCKSGGTLLTVKFDYGETREVPQASTIQETVWDARQMEPKC